MARRGDSAPLDIGIGVNSGDMIAGNIGSSSIMSYTVIGDNVNLGARLESLEQGLPDPDYHQRRHPDAPAGPLRRPAARGRHRQGQDPAGRDFRGRRAVARLEEPTEEVTHENNGSCRRPAARDGAGVRAARQAGQAHCETRRSKVGDLNMTEQEERELGEQVSATVRTEFGVYQDAAVTKYVDAGRHRARAGQLARPDLKWEFIVLDTDGVNAFAAPGRVRAHHQGRARADQERSGAGRRARSRDRARHREAHGQGDPEEQGDQAGDRSRPAARERLHHRARRRRLRQHRRDVASTAATRTRPTKRGSGSPTRPATTPRRSDRSSAS